MGSVRNGLYGLRLDLAVLTVFHYRVVSETQLAKLQIKPL